ncbi:hypothetical protein BCV70DRAFT_114173 [Testicularia cyperi]|uniref:Secreted protein n=1 Tax=Testicularia cyperi TaxID=1882483 RepID=A0A317XPR9_9BASI|nr:hypothetical protein BCV70DRAFT_114173 [Testicularia cyperi]
MIMRAVQVILIALYLGLMTCSATPHSPARISLTNRHLVAMRRDKSSQKPHERCNGAKMYYTPLVLKTKHWPELGVCDSSCEPLADFYSATATISSSSSIKTESSDVDARAASAGLKSSADRVVDKRDRKRRLQGNWKSDDRRVFAVSAQPSRRADTNKDDDGDDLVWYCDETVTLPEDDLDPDEYKDKFPFNARTCFATNGEDHGRYAQIMFEKACIQAQGQFTNPVYKTWLDH